MAKKFWKFKLNLDKFVEDKEKLLIEAIDEALEYIKQRIDEKTPEDTGDLVENNKIHRAKKVDGVISWSVKNETGYAIYVEYGRSKTEGVPKAGITFRYNKPKGTNFYTWVGARMFTRTADEEKAFIINLIKTKVLWKS